MDVDLNTSKNMFSPHSIHMRDTISNEGKRDIGEC